MASNQQGSIFKQIVVALMGDTSDLVGKLNQADQQLAQLMTRQANREKDLAAQQKKFSQQADALANQREKADRNRALQRVTNEKAFNKALEQQAASTNRIIELNKKLEAQLAQLNKQKQAFEQGARREAAAGNLDDSIRLRRAAMEAESQIAAAKEKTNALIQRQIALLNSSDDSLRAIHQRELNQQADREAAIKRITNAQDQLSEASAKAGRDGAAAFARMGLQIDQLNRRIDSLKAKLRQPFGSFGSGFNTGWNRGLKNVLGFDEDDIKNLFAKLRNPANLLGALGGGIGFGLSNLITSPFRLAKLAVNEFFDVIRRAPSIMAGFIRSATQAHLEVVRFAKQTGESLQASQRFVGLFRALGMDVTFASIGIGALNKEIAKNNQFITKWGIATRNADGTMRSATQVLDDMRVKFQALDKAGRQSFLADFNQMMPFAGTILPAITVDPAILTTLEELNIILDELEQKNMNTVSGSMLGLQAAGLGLANTVTTALAPAIKAFANIVINFLAAHMDEIFAFFRAIANGVADVLGVLGLLKGPDVVGSYAAVIEGQAGAEAATESWSEDLNEINDQMRSLKPEIDAANDAIDRQRDHIDALRESMEDELDAIERQKRAVQEWADAQTTPLEKANKALERQKRAIQEALEAQVEPIEESIKLLQKRAKAWDDEADIALDAIDREIKALDKANRAIDRQLEATTRPLQQRLREIRDQREAWDDAKEAQLDALGARPEADSGVLRDIDHQVDAIEDQIDAIKRAGDAFRKEQEDILDTHDAARDALQDQMEAIRDAQDEFMEAHEEQQRLIEERIAAIKELGDAEEREARDRDYYDRRAYLMGETLLAQAERRARALSDRQSRQRQAGESDIDYQLRIMSLNAENDVDQLKRQGELAELDAQRAIELANRAREDQIKLQEQALKQIEEEIRLRRKADDEAIEALQDQAELLEDLMEAIRDQMEARKEADDEAIDSLQQQRDALRDQSEALREAAEIAQEAWDAKREAIEEAHEAAVDALEDEQKAIDRHIESLEEAARVQTEANNLQIEQLRERRDVLDEFYSREREAIQDSIEAKQEQIEAYREAADNQIEVIDDTIQANNDQIDAIREVTDEQIKSLDRAAQSVRDFYEPQIESAEEVLEGLQDQLETLQDLNSELQQAKTNAEALYADPASGGNGLVDAAADAGRELTALRLLLIDIANWVDRAFFDPFRSPRERFMAEGRREYMKNPERDAEGDAIPWEQSGRKRVMEAQAAEIARETGGKFDEKPSIAEGIKEIFENAWEEVKPIVSRIISEFGDLVFNAIAALKDNPRWSMGIALAIAYIALGFPPVVAFLLGVITRKLLEDAADKFGIREWMDKVWGAITDAILSGYFFVAIGIALGLMFYLYVPAPLAIIIGFGIAAGIKETLKWLSENTPIDEWVQRVWSEVSNFIKDHKWAQALAIALGLQILAVPFPIALIIGIAKAYGLGPGDVTEFLGDIGGWIGGIWDGTIDAIKNTNWFAVLGTAFGLKALGVPFPLGLLFGIGSELGLNAMGVSWGDVGQWLNDNVWRPIENFFTETVPRWIGNVASLPDTFFDTLGGGFSGIKGWFTDNVWNPVASIFEGGGGGTMSIGLSGMMGVWSNLMSSAFFSGMGEGFANLPGWLNDNIFQRFSFVWEGPGGLLSSGVNWVGRFAGDFFANMSLGFGSTPSFLNNLILNPFQWLWENPGGLLASGVRWVGQFSGDFFGNMGRGFAGLSNWLNDNIFVPFMRLFDFELIQNLIRWVGNIGRTFFDNMSFAFQPLTNWFQQYISGPIDSAWNGVLGIVDRVSNSLERALMRPFEFVRDNVESVLNAMRENALRPLRTARERFIDFAGSLQSAGNWIGNKVGLGNVFGTIGDIRNAVPGFASGVSGFEGGLAWVGEEGPELAYLPPGTSIMPAEESMVFSQVMGLHRPKGKEHMQNWGLAIGGGGFPGFAPGIGDLKDLGKDVFDKVKSGAGAVKDFIEEWANKPIEWLIDKALSTVGFSKDGFQLPGVLKDLPKKFFEDKLLGGLIDVATAWIKGGKDALEEMVSGEISGLGERGLENIFRVGRYVATQGYGYTPFSGVYAGGFHHGVDIASVGGVKYPLAIPGAGEVIQAGWNDGYGNAVTMRLFNGLKVLIGHLDSIAVHIGQRLDNLEAKIGNMGTTGFSSGVHAHVQTWNPHGAEINPEPFFPSFFRKGGIIKPNSTLVDANGRPYAFAGEAGLEAVTPIDFLKGIVRSSVERGIVAANAPMTISEKMGGPTLNLTIGEIHANSREDGKAIANAVVKELENWFDRIPAIAPSVMQREVR